jgi:hypothetical protein
VRTGVADSFCVILGHWVCGFFGGGQDGGMSKQPDDIRVRRFWALDPTNQDTLMLGTFDGTVHRFGVIINDGIRGFATQAEAEGYLADFRGDGHLVTMVEGPEEGGLPEGWK